MVLSPCTATTLPVNTARFSRSKTSSRSESILIGSLLLVPRLSGFALSFLASLAARGAVEGEEDGEGAGLAGGGGGGGEGGGGGWGARRGGGRLLRAPAPGPRQRRAHDGDERREECEGV